MFKPGQIVRGKSLEEQYDLTARYNFGSANAEAQKKLAGKLFIIIDELDRDIQHSDDLIYTKDIITGNKMGGYFASRFKEL